jgi:hypothetical protein
MEDAMKTHPAVSLFCGVFVALITVACSEAKAPDTEVRPLGDHLSFAGESVQLNTTSTGRHSLVKGTIGASGPLSLIVDTGAGASVIDRALVETLGLQKVGEREVLSGGVEPVQSDIVLVPVVTVDGLTIRDAEFLVMDLEAMSMGTMQAVLGMPLFRDALLSLDPNNGRITVSRDSLAADGPGVFTYRPYAGSAFEFDLTVAGRKVPMVFDTGAPSGFTFPMALKDSLPLKGALREGPSARLVGGTRSQMLGALDGTVQLGELAYANPDVAFMSPSAPHGTIGNAILGDLVLDIDQQHGLIALRKSEAAAGGRDAAVAGSAKPRRIGVQFRGMPGGGALTIGTVDPGSLGEQAGLETGDVLVGLNGKPAESYDMKALGALFRGSTPLRFEVMRNGEKRMLEIP